VLGFGELPLSANLSIILSRRLGGDFMDGLGDPSLVSRLTAHWWRLRNRSVRTPQNVIEYLDGLFEHFPFTAQAQHWLRRSVRVAIRDLTSHRGGGFFYPLQGRVFLFTAQYEAAIHELAHAWWDVRRHRHKDQLISALLRAAMETDPQYREIAALARDYVLGSEDGQFEGLLLSRNDTEIYAGLASGCMANIQLLPPYLREFYQDLFELTPEPLPHHSA